MQGGGKEMGRTREAFYHTTLFLYLYTGFSNLKDKGGLIAPRNSGEKD